MKRFYKTVAIGDDRSILLDGRSVKTPARQPLMLPGAALAEAVAEEWRAQGETIDPRTMPLTGLANAAIDRVAPDPDAFTATLAPYAETDLLCYRADEPADLVARQAEAWDPLLEWARGRYDIGFEVVTGIVHRAQHEATVARLAAALAACDPFRLAALSPLVTIGGSLVAALALAEGRIEAGTAFEATHLDELWQAEQWGEDPFAADARAARRRDFEAAARFLALLDG
ncbi:ATP12 family chaperone protein [Flavisphingomonas formosensis]|uniref:ATP12 family chaperone protein n=1 Tax=Flavisphingomonas formosensis TaxID=861534 RepID=UPI0012FC5C9B|nr:ATP12 family protein [Sphingomonas formosensis]